MGTRRRESERNGERDRQRQRESERGESEMARDKGGHGSRGVTGGEPDGGQRRTGREPDWNRTVAGCEHPKLDEFKKAARVEVPNAEGENNE